MRTFEGTREALWEGSMQKKGMVLSSFAYVVPIIGSIRQAPRKAEA